MAVAKRGDLVLIEERRDHGHKGPEFVLERVAGVTRDGLVKATIARAFGFDDEPRPLFRIQQSHGKPVPRYRCYYQTHYVIPAADVDVEAMWAAWCQREGEYTYEHSYGSHGYTTNPEEFRSLDEAKTFARPFRRETVAA